MFDPQTFRRPQRQSPRLRDLDGKPFDPDTGREMGIPYNMTHALSGRSQGRKKVKNWNGYFINDPYV